MSSPAEFLDTTGPAPMAALDRVLRKRTLQALAQLRGGQVRLRDADGDTLLGHPDGASPVFVDLRVYDAAFWRQIAGNGSVGAGEAYMDGAWDCDDLVGLVRLLVRNRDHLDAIDSGLARFAGWAMRAVHSMRRNTRNGSRRNISARFSGRFSCREVFLFIGRR